MMDMEIVPASFGQERMWLLAQLQDKSGIVTPLAFRISGPIDADLLSRSLDIIGRRHEILRTTFAFSQGSLQQQVGEEHHIGLEQVDISGMTAAEQGQWLQERARQEALRDYDLERGSLLILSLVRLSGEESVLFLSSSHLVIDAWSRAIFLDELSAIYASLVEDRPPALPDLPIQYADFAIWERENQDLAGEKEQAARWIAQWGEHDSTLDLPTDHQRPAVPGVVGAGYGWRLAAERRASLEKLASEENATLFMVLMAGFQTLLARYTGQERFFIGVPAAGRENSQLQPLIGLFMNMLALPADVSGRPTFRELVGRVRANFLEMIAHQDLRLDRVVEALGLERDASRNILFQVMFQMRNTPAEVLRLPGLETASMPLERHVARLELTLEADPRTGPDLALLLEYNSDLYKAATIRRMARHLSRLLEAAATDPDLPVHRLPLLGDDEQRRILVQWNQTQRDYPDGPSLVDLFEKQASDRPASTAFIDGDSRLSFQEANQRANRLGLALTKSGAGPGITVGLMMDRSLEAMVAFLAILKSGATYLPLDPSYPRQRLAYMIEDAAASILLTSAGRGGEASELAGQSAHRPLVQLAEEAMEGAAPTGNLGIRVPPGAPAYIIYTSGSTGRPKGVLIPHRQILNRLYWMWQDYPFRPGEVGCLKTALNFVDSLWEMLGYTLKGVPVLILADEVVRDPDALLEALARHGVSRLWLVPTLLRALLESTPDLAGRLPNLKHWIVSGEALPAELFSQFEAALPESTLYNLYGTSEIWDATWFDPELEEGDYWTAPIGRPIANVETYILDNHLQPVPVGVAGELFVSGQGLADGYLGRPGLTADRFLPNPFASRPGDRLYRSGDLVRWLHDGNIEFIGRVDHQVKIRGYRVEPAEVETILVRHPAIHRAVVVAQKDRRHEPRLVAYVQFQDGQSVPVADLRRFLADTLPDFMIPARMVGLDGLPLTPSGKVDRLRLPALDAAVSLEPQPASDTTDRPLEHHLARIWADVLELPAVSFEDDFFALGGHSLIAMNLISQIEKLTGVKVPLNTIFRAPTIRSLAEEMRQNRFNIGERSLVPIRPEGDGPPLYCVHGLFGRVFFLYDLAHHLPENLPVFGLQFYQPSPADAVHQSIEEMAVHYVAEIVDHQPDGPYLLCGFSLGGMIAYEMARNLMSQGKEVKLVGLFDTAISRTPGFVRASLPLSGRLALNAFRLRTSIQTLADGRVRRPDAAEEVDPLAHRVWHQQLMPEGVASPPAAFEHFALAGVKAALKYVPGRYPGRLILFRAEGRRQAMFDRETYGWRYLADDVTVDWVPGNHVTMLKEPHVIGLAETLGEQIERALEQGRQR